MLHFRHINTLLIAVIALSVLTGCASDHFFPRLKTPFVGLDEAGIPASAKPALAQAKEDFWLCQHGKAPRHACCAKTYPCAHSQVFAGRGYQITLVDNDLVRPQQHGVTVELESSLTGGKPFHLDDIDRSAD